MRKNLMAPFLKQYDVWDQLGDAIEEVWQKLGIDDNIQKLQWLRSPVLPGSVVLQSGDKLLSLNDMPTHERSTLVMTADLLGFRMNAPNLLRHKDYLRLCQNLASYYVTTKGTPNWINFLSWCLEAKFTQKRTYTRDFKTFLVEGDPAIGRKLQDGGEWYPTSHVLFEYDAERWQGTHPSVMVQLFNYFANINLVLWMTQLAGRFDVPVQAAITGSIQITYPGK